MSQQTIWQNVLDHVRKRVSEVEFQTWFERIKPLGVREGVLELGVPTSFAGDWISKHYAPLIQEGLARLGAEAPRFELRVLPAGDTARLLARLRRAHCGEQVLVVGHSNTVPEVAQAFGGAPFEIGETEYGRIYTLRPPAAQLQRETFGQAPASAP